MKKVFYIIISCAVANALALLSQDVAYAQDGSEAFPMSKVVKDPVLMGMGGAGMASSSSMAWSAFANPSKIPFVDKKFDAQFSYLAWNVEGSPSKSLDLGGTFKFNKNVGMTFGASYTSWNAYDIYYETNPSESAGTYKPKDIQADLGFGLRLFPYVSVGANARFLHSSISSDASCSAIAADLMFMTDFSFAGLDGLKATAGITEIGAVSSDDDNSYELPAAVSFGTSYLATFGEKHGIEANLDADYYINGGSVSISFGGRYDFNDMISLRAGYRAGGKSAVPSFATAGLGLRFAGVQFDAAYVIGSGGLKNSVIFGLGYAF